MFVPTKTSARVGVQACGTKRAHEAIAALSEGAHDCDPVSGWTHSFYRYPARFSPRFAAAAITNFSRPGEVVLDPYMGAGTVIVEGLVTGRKVVGNDLNSLATFVAKVKTTPLESRETLALRLWADKEITTFNYRIPGEQLAKHIDPEKIRNLHLLRARFIKKAIAAALRSIVGLPTGNAQDFARCAVLRVGQWALDGRGRHTSLREFRSKLINTTHEMLDAIILLGHAIKSGGSLATILNQDASTLDELNLFRRASNQASLVVTSPPYPGVHVLYHRWQVDGRRETPAPYWIVGRNDGQGASFYNFGDRRQSAADAYFDTSLRTLKAIRQVIRDGAYMIQMIAFNNPDEQLLRYLDNMRAAGFTEFTDAAPLTRIWREVPNRKWHATLKGKTHSAREVVLIHRAT